ncbi:MAG: PAS domain S-box protein, partial [Bacteroidales bacterium]
MSRKTQISGRSEEILIVEDSPTQAEQLRHLLETHNYRSEIASNGREAFTWLSAHKPSMVISDVIMPGINGFELCKIIKTGKSTSDIPVILVTSLSNTEEVISGLTAGADSILTKPYNDEHLLSCVAKVLDQYDRGEIVRETENVQINYGGRKRIIHTEPQKVINLLLDIYQGAIYQNEKLGQVKDELRRLNEHLETLVKERTSDLSKEIEVNEEITARLRESEIKYRNIVETANEGIWKIDADYVTTFVNEKLAQMFGYRSEEMIGKSVFDFMEEEESDAAGNPETRNFRSKGSFEQTYRRKDGTSITTVVNVTPFGDSEGRYAGSIELLTDITERKKVEAALKESREKLNMALENGDIGTWEWNLNTDEIFCDQHFRKMFGFEARSALIPANEFEKLILDEDRLQVMNSITESIRNGDPCEISFRSKFPNGKVRHFNLKALVSE